MHKSEWAATQKNVFGNMKSQLDQQAELLLARPWKKADRCLNQAARKANQPNKAICQYVSAALPQERS